MLSPLTKYDNRAKTKTNGNSQQSFRDLYHAEKDMKGRWAGQIRPSGWQRTIRFWSIMWPEYLPLTWPHFPSPEWEKHFPLYTSQRKITQFALTQCDNFPQQNTKRPSKRWETWNYNTRKRLISRNLDPVISRGKRFSLKSRILLLP